MSELIAQLMPLNVLKEVQQNLMGYIQDQICDVRRGHLYQVDDEALQSLLIVQQVIREKEGN
jgi:hypothetical protein